VTLPSKLEPKIFSPRMAIRLAVAPDGGVGKVEITKSSGIADVDRQVREGAGRWCMEKTKEGREVDFLINLDVR
jgi:TonB family protein